MEFPCRLSICVLNDIQPYTHTFLKNASVYPGFHKNLCVQYKNPGKQKRSLRMCANYQQVYYLTGAVQDSISEKTWCCPTLWGIQYQITILILKRFTYEPMSYTKFHSVSNPMLALFILSDFSNFLFNLFNCCNQLSLIGLKKKQKKKAVLFFLQTRKTQFFARTSCHCTHF